MITENDLTTLWNTVIPQLEKSLNRPIYEALISSTKPHRVEGETLHIAVPNELVKDWLSKHTVTLLEQEVRQVDESITAVHFFVGPPEMFDTPLLEKTAYRVEKLSTPAVPFLNPRYTFNHFVVGHGNRFAHAASLAVAEAPAKAYNPLFLYGGVGLGKTHLMQAIGHHVVSQKPSAKILYITSETFTNELINAIRDDKTIQFRNKYRSIDVLLVDDVQFLAGKERTQEEFFHTFNTLYEANKQIVVSSDRPPKEIPTLEERLRSRFEWGLTADIQAPDFETRIAILKKKAETSNIAIADDILSYIGSRVVSNIRELEGALIRVVAFASLHKTEISPGVVDDALKNILAPGGQEKKNLSIELIKKGVAEHYQVNLDDLSAKIRTREIAEARQIAMYLSRVLTQASFPKIGSEFGGRDHTTVLHACEKIKGVLKKDKATVEAINTITKRLKSYQL